MRRLSGVVQAGALPQLFVSAGIFIRWMTVFERMTL
jgi:hypothetical protein